LHICATRRLGERCPKNYLAVDRCTCCYGESGKSKDGKSCWCTVLRRRCKHVLEADHNLPLQDWLELLLLYDRAGHAEPPLPRPAGALSREGRLALMEERAAAGLAIFSPRDVRAGEDEQVSVQALKGRRQGGLIR
jgi:hypothetical protein